MTFFFDHDVPEDATFTLEAMGHLVKVNRLRQVLPAKTTDERRIPNIVGNIRRT